MTTDVITSLQQFTSFEAFRQALDTMYPKCTKRMLVRITAYYANKMLVASWDGVYNTGVIEQPAPAGCPVEG